MIPEKVSKWWAISFGALLFLALGLYGSNAVLNQKIENHPVVIRGGHELSFISCRLDTLIQLARSGNGEVHLIKEKVDSLLHWEY